MSFQIQRSSTKYYFSMCLLSIVLYETAATYTKDTDLTLVGFVNSSGIGHVATAFIECVDKNLSMNFKSCRQNDLKNVSREVANMVQKPYHKPGRVAILTHILEAHEAVPQQSTIKIAYSMIEFSKLPPLWPKILNEHFDAVVVPDEWLVGVYQKSGVRIPIFVLPLTLALESFLARTPKLKRPTPLIFGNVGAGKNPTMVVEAFIRAFGQTTDVLLRLHSQRPEPFVKSLVDLKRQQGFNILYEEGQLSPAQYADYMSSFDCYVSLSNGEGFAIPPREALALGIPIIITNNSALKTICKTTYARCVPSEIPMPAFPGGLWPDEQLGYYSQCSVEDAADAFRDVYAHYEKHLKKARLGRHWVKQYLPQALRKQYVNLIKPKTIILGNKNKITNEYLMTNSVQLYKKYLKIGSKGKRMLS